ncbi:MAG: CPBP family intramembrane metalloprotease [Candidatus Eisenbacteria bacterium]|nr:CPBP family intramembrane metalloprotease [Candidatus Eisenbacteria bacterium]
MRDSGRKWLRLPLGLLLVGIVFAGGGAISQAVSRIISNDLAMKGWLSTTIFQLSMGFIAVVIMLILGRGRLKGFGFSRGTHFPLFKVLLLVLVVEVLVSVVFIPFPTPGESHFATDFSFWQIVVGIWIVASTMEEVVDRGLFQSFLAPLAGCRLSLPRVTLSLPVIAGAIVFSASHIPLLMMGIDPTLGTQILVSTFALGLIAGYFREATGSLLPAIVAHSFANMVGMGTMALFEALGL